MIENLPSEEGKVIRKGIRPRRVIIVIAVVVLCALICFVVYTGHLARPYDRTMVAYSNVTIEDGDDLQAVA